MHKARIIITNILPESGGTVEFEKGKSRRTGNSGLARSMPIPPLHELAQNPKRNGPVLPIPRAARNGLSFVNPIAVQ